MDKKLVDKALDKPTGRPVDKKIDAAAGKDYGQLNECWTKLFFKVQALFNDREV